MRILISFLDLYDSFIQGKYNQPCQYFSKISSLFEVKEDGRSFYFFRSEINFNLFLLEW